jgi:hypothetical protein
MSRYCKCFFSNKKKYLLEKKENTNTLLYYYDKIHNSPCSISEDSYMSNSIKEEFSQIKYINTIYEVNRLKQKLLHK